MAETPGELSWDEVAERFTAAQNWWVSTSSPESGPHAVPVWGVVLDGVLAFYGEASSRRSRNLAADPRAVVHLESGSDVLVVHVLARAVGPAHTHPRACALYAEKYTDPSDVRWLPDAPGMEDVELWRAEPQRALSWSLYGEDSLQTRRWSAS
jgi:hypothetical protein